MNCADKRAYRSPAKARKALRGSRYFTQYILKRGGVPVAFYKCPHGEHWHLTSKPQAAA